MNTINMNEKIIKNCKHSGVLIKIGYWDGAERKTGKQVSGPVVVCETCGKKLNIPWKEWRELKDPCLVQ